MFCLSIMLYLPLLVNKDEYNMRSEKNIPSDKLTLLYLLFLFSYSFVKLNLCKNVYMQKLFKGIVLLLDAIRSFVQQFFIAVSE